MSQNEMKIEMFINWGFRISVTALCFIAWSFLTEMRSDMKRVLEETTILKTKMEIAHPELKKQWTK